ncbi:hypothetical protein M8494_14630 [Serratia ureilytica]
MVEGAQLGCGLVGALGDFTGRSKCGIQRRFRHGFKIWLVADQRDKDLCAFLRAECSIKHFAFKGRQLSTLRQFDPRNQQFSLAITAC